MDQYYTEITPLGEAKMTAATVGSPLVMDSFAVGFDPADTTYNSNVSFPTSFDTFTLFSASLESDAISPVHSNWRELECIIPATTGGYDINRIAIFNDAGEMMYFGSIPLTTLPDPASGATRALVLDVVIALLGAVDAGAVSINVIANSLHSHTFDEITGKPATYPPSTHSHSWAQTTGKPATYPPSTHSHSWAQTTGKPATYPPSTHSHSWAQTTGKPATFPPSTHNHDPRIVDLIKQGVFDSGWIVLAVNQTKTVTHSLGFIPYRAQLLIKDTSGNIYLGGNMTNSGDNYFGTAIISMTTSSILIKSSNSGIWHGPLTGNHFSTGSFKIVV